MNRYQCKVGMLVKLKVGEFYASLNRIDSTLYTMMAANGLFKVTKLLRGPKVEISPIVNQSMRITVDVSSLLLTQINVDEILDECVCRSRKDED